MYKEQTITKDFLEAFPNIKRGPLMGDDDLELPYCFFGNVHSILLESYTEEPDLAQQIVDWLNLVLNHNDTDEYVKDMLWIEFFEGAEAQDFHRNFLLSHLSEKALVMFRQYLYVVEHGGFTNPDTGEILERRKKTNILMNTSILVSMFRISSS